MMSNNILMLKLSSQVKAYISLKMNYEKMHISGKQQFQGAKDLNYQLLMILYLMLNIMLENKAHQLKFQNYLLLSIL